MLQKLRMFFLLKNAQKTAQKGNPSASNLFDKLIQQYPEYAFGYYHFARYWVDQQDWQKAQENIEKALTIKPTNPIFHHYQGVIYYHQKKYAEAIQSLQNALKLDPLNCLTQNYMALIHLAQGQLAEFKKIIENVGMFESDDLQIAILFTLENHLKQKELATSK